jgi:protein tyrosine/serine phosphatase
MTFSKTLSVSRVSALSLIAALAGATAFAAPAVEGVRNFQVVNDRVLRGGQPGAEGFRSLSAAGVRTVLDLRESGERSKAEKDLVKSLGMKYVNIPMKGMHTPSDGDVRHALRVLRDEDAGPVFVHCQRGADRTGMVVAAYRMEHDGWSNGQALKEARGYGMSWYQYPLIRYVLAYQPKKGGIQDATAGAADALRGFGQDAVESVKGITRGLGGEEK